MDTRFNQTPQPFNMQKQQHIPGLKVAYGLQSGQNPQQFQNEPTNTSTQTPKSRNPLGRLMEGLFHLVTEEVSDERPIGISQLSRNTFRTDAKKGNRTFVRPETSMQDYRFNQLIHPDRQR